ncbi:Replication protein O [Klebsiella pneumoniae]|uniref:Replication protein O n=1 Tax=Klebsiella pneumoniae TaxID=573 RepID=A0A378ACF0_KLEPN|nr:Replication protein O [Klebsiella pneumoniae]STV05706.1 Replication protein O [Klebsiella pneumoniae]
MSNQVFEIVQAMSGQGNCITIPGPYLDFFAGDRQQHLLAAILNQLVFWSGKSVLENGWFYKEHAALAKEVRAKDGDVVRKAMYKMIEQYLADVIEEELRQVNGTPKKHYRIDQEALIAKIFPSTLDSAFKPNGNGSRAEWKRPKSRIQESAHKPNGNGSQAESYLYTDLKNTDLKTDLKNQGGKASPVDKSNQEIEIQDATEDSNLATDEDFDLAMWFWSTIIEMYERAAEFDGTLARPREPNFVGWANEVRLIRQEHGCTYEQIRTMVERIQRDRFWCPKIQSLPMLRSKWPELVLKLCSGNLATGNAFGMGGGLDTHIPKGFRG